MGRILNFDFGSYLKMKLDEMDLTIRELSHMTNIPISVLYKITSSEPRKTTCQEFIVILDALNADLDEFLDYALGRPKSVKITRVLLERLTKEEKLILLDMITNATTEDREFLFRSLKEFNKSILGTKRMKMSHKK